MKQFFYLSVFCALALGACTGAFKKGDKGLEYKVISTGSGKTIPYGNFIQIHIKQVYGGNKDTVLSDSRDMVAPIQLFDSVNTPMAYYKIIKQLRKGDSLIIRQLTDTAFRDSQQGMPPFMKKGKYIYTHVKLVNIFATQLEADSANKAERAIAKPRVFKKQMEEVEKEIAKFNDQRKIDDKIIVDYLAKNNIKAEKANWGTYVSVTTEGTGEKMNYDNIAMVNYTGRTLDSGRVFDSNLDPKFKHTEPLQFTMMNLGAVIFGFTDAFQLLKKGTKATIYIPSSLGYGKEGSQVLKPNENLIFDVEITDVMTAAEFAAKQMEIQEKMMEAQKSQADSIQKATKK
jgi:FKBP-type peptidyl-prolyl cis-trans isomerase